MSTDNPRLSNRLWHGGLNQPRIVVLDPFLRHIRMLGGGRKARNIIVCCSDKVELPEHSHRDVTFLPCRTCYDGSLDLVDVLINLRRGHGIKSLMVEGGPTLLGKFMEAQLFDGVYITIAPIIFGSGLGISIPGGISFTGNEIYHHRFDEDICLAAFPKKN